MLFAYTRGYFCAKKLFSRTLGFARPMIFLYSTYVEESDPGDIILMVKESYFAAKTFEIDYSKNDLYIGTCNHFAVKAVKEWLTNAAKEETLLRILREHDHLENLINEEEWLFEYHEWVNELRLKHAELGGHPTPSWFVPVLQQTCEHISNHIGVDFGEKLKEVYRTAIENRSRPAKSIFRIC